MTLYSLYGEKLCLQWSYVTKYKWNLFKDSSPNRSRNNLPSTGSKKVVIARRNDEAIYHANDRR